MYLPQKIRRVLTIVSLSLLGLTACVSVNDDSQALRTTVVTSGDLSQLPPSAMTYSWHPTLQKIFVDRRLDQQQVLQHMQDTLKKVLLTKGYRWVEDPQLADFQVGFGIAMGTQMSDEQILAAAGLVPGLSNQGVDLKKYDKAFLSQRALRVSLMRWYGEFLAKALPILRIWTKSKPASMAQSRKCYYRCPPPMRCNRADILAQ